MKLLTTICPVIILLCCGCHRENHLPVSRWESENCFSDSLSARLDQLFATGKTSGDIRATLDSLPDSETGRRCYWEARISAARGDVDQARRFLDKALNFTDSCSRSYDNARIRHAIVGLSDSSMGSKYTSLCRLLEFYEDRDDSLMIADASNDISLLLGRAGLYDMASEYLTRAHEIFGKQGYEEYAVKIMLNGAISCYEAGDKSRGDSIINRLLCNPVARADTSFYCNVLFASFYNNRRKTDLLRRAIILNRKCRLSPEKLTKYLYYMGETYLDTGNNDSARFYLEAAASRLTPATSIDLRADVYSTYSIWLSRTNRPDSALKFYNRFLNLHDSVEASTNQKEVIRLAAQKEITEITARMEDERRRHINLIIFITFGFIIVILASVFTVHRITRRLRNKNRYNLLNSRRQQRELVSSSLLLTEKTNLISNLSEHIDSLSSLNKISRADAASLQNKIKLHKSVQGEWEGFRVLFEQEFPSFVDNLKSSGKNLTKGDIHLAMYIRVGLTSKQIARLMNILPNSVKKNRHRLREKLNLAPDTDIEDFLASL